MGNSFFNLPVPPGNGVGAPIDTDAMGGEKTITVQDAFRGAVNIEISCDGGGTRQGAGAGLAGASSAGPADACAACAALRARVAVSNTIISTRVPSGKMNTSIL